jgi:Ca2+-binding RTX toxin-like protein
LSSEHGANPSLVVIPNGDGTLTKAFGTFSVLNAVVTGGSIASLERTSADGATVYESITGLALDALVFVTTAFDALSLAFAGATTLNGYSGTDSLRGGAESDTLYGNGGDDELLGGAGDDAITGGPGADTIVGGSGFDFTSYATAPSGVVAQLGPTGANTGDAAGDDYEGIEGLIGSYRRRHGVSLLRPQ